MSNLVLLAGIPGSGKSTMAENFFSDYAYVSSDEIRKEMVGSIKTAINNEVSPWDVFYGRIAESLLEGNNTVADATFLKPEHRARARTLAKSLHANIHIIVFKNIVDAVGRNLQRPQDTQVPGETMIAFQRMLYDLLEVLDREEYNTTTIINRYS